MRPTTCTTSIPPRRGGARRRLWSRYINDAIERYGDKTEIVIAQHHWPMWGKARIVAFLKKQRDLYKYIHDQTRATDSIMASRRRKSPSS